jgi:hypothetical protein
MVTKCLNAGLVGALLLSHPTPQRQPGQASQSTAPLVIYWPGAGPSDRKNPTEVGLLYTPELLQKLANQSPAAVTDRIRDAIRLQTPIVLLWTIPPSADSPPFPRPYSAVIERPDGNSSVPRVEPLWVEQDAEELRRLDPARSFESVGVVAAFPRSAFVSGSVVIIYRDFGRSESGQSRRVQRFGAIEWSGSGS